MPTEKDHALLQHLIDSTDTGSIKWETTAEDYQFRTGFKGKYDVTVDKSYMPNGDEYYWMILTDVEADRELVRISYAEANAVRELYLKAQRASLNVDAVIDEIIAFGNDIPF